MIVDEDMNYLSAYGPARVFVSGDTLKNETL